MSEEESFRVTDRRGREDLTAGAPTGAAPSGLGTLFMMFTSSALVNLGAVPDPETDERRVDLEQARAAIDVLLLLRDKTQGNRTEQESRLLEDILYDLQMRFVHSARGPAQSSGS